MPNNVSAGRNYSASAPLGNNVKCPKCEGSFILRVHRKWYQKIFNRKKHYRCHDCNTHFWK
ncbi:MAG: hypothetical protein KJ914_09470 [Gammaproteobacteria bacterium]|nr:hypothetical protein [Gammaproteobacteria bacterium]MBU1722696.1 hypothetical protein [Gammaproteobacteria bacterium]MBU2006664.1 hypothetical protein [Gammaproteobacteria bacterium]